MDTCCEEGEKSDWWRGTEFKCCQFNIFSDKLKLDNAADELIVTAIDAGYSTDFANYVAGGFITGINAVNSTDCAYLLISNDTVDELIATAIDAGNSTGCAEDFAGGFIYAINAGNLMVKWYHWA